MKFFFDNNLSPDLARGLAKLRNAFGEEIVHLRDKYDDAATPDSQWLSDLIEEGGWIVISADRFKKNSAERLAVTNPAITVFMFTSSISKKRRWEKTLIIVKRWEEIVAASKGNGKGKCFRVRLQGKIEKI